MTKCPAVLAMLALILAACLSVPRRGSEQGRDLTVDASEKIVVSQILLRRGRGSDGRLFAPSVGRLADEAAKVALDIEYAFDAWAALLPEQGVLSVVAWPSEHALATVVLERLRRVCEGPERVVLVDDPAQAGAEAIWVMAPRWAEQRVHPELLPALSAWRQRVQRAPRLVLIDLIEPEMGNGRWLADEIIVSSSPRAAVVVAEYELASRAAGAIANAGEIARRRSLKWGQIRWIRRSVQP